MEKQNLIAAFALSSNKEQKISLIGSTVVINNFESKLNKYNKNYSDKNLLKNKGRIIIKVINNYTDENIDLNLKYRFFLEKYFLKLGEYCITYSDIFFTKEFFNEVIQGKKLELFDKIFIFEDLD
jgi:hypothetical protein